MAWHVESNILAKLDWAWVWGLEVETRIMRLEFRIEDWDLDWGLRVGNWVLTMCIGGLGFLCIN